LAWKVRTYGALKEAIDGALANEAGPSIIQVVVPEKCDLPGIRWAVNPEKAKEGT
jgi:hypothetical protein